MTASESISLVVAAFFLAHVVWWVFTLWSDE